MRGNYLVGPRKTLLVDPQKDIDVKYIAIGGVEREDKGVLFVWIFSQWIDKIRCIILKFKEMIKVQV